LQTITLRPSEHELDGLTITARRPVVEFKPDRTVVNLDASITNVGTTVMEALEKLPGVSLGRDGVISLKGRTGVTVMIDGKQTYLDGAELVNLLSGMNASQASQIELIDNPSAKQDAAGNAGIINIKTKKGTLQGFNGTLTVGGQQGFYPRTTNNLLLNFRSGKANYFLNYGVVSGLGLTRVYALRTYFKNDGTIASLLEQPSFLTGNSTANNLVAGVDYSITNATSVGISLTGQWQDFGNKGNNSAVWMQANRKIDSIVQTVSNSQTSRRKTGASLNFKHQFSVLQQLSADVEKISNRKHENQVVENSTSNYTEGYRAYVPTDYDIFSAKVDYSEQRGPVKLDAGFKTSSVNTDNLSAYETGNGITWTTDPSKSNHFLYKENIHAFYLNSQAKRSHWDLQAGLRFEWTKYNAKQLLKGDDFSRNYNGLFPSLSVAFEKDSSNSFSLSAGRRIDRPNYRDLDPFIRIINKYTYQQGNPYYQPQYTWNMQLSHAYKNILLTSLSYSITTDYFSQVFKTYASGIVLYTYGNLGRRENLGASVGLQLSPLPWWSFVLQAQAVHKHLQGEIDNRMMVANITQYSLNLNNQMRFKKGWSGEVSGFYNSSSQEDIQEVLDPYGQLSLGVQKMVWQNKGSVKLTLRDVFYTGWFKGLSQFAQSTEYFKMTRDTRLAVLSFIWRFGQAYKVEKHAEGAASDELQRAGSD
jgi:iron complex outermembrane receptor protein